MREEQSRRELRRRLLPFVLALMLWWYTVNPAPTPLPRRSHGGAEDEAEREAEEAPVRRQTRTVNDERDLWGTTALSQGSNAQGAAPVEPEELDWPEYLDLD